MSYGITTLPGGILTGRFLFKEPVRTIATTPITLSGLQSISGYTVKVGDRVLVNGQTSPVDNGIYVASAGAWKRASDASGVGVLLHDSVVMVTAGNETVNGSFWVLSGGSDPVIGVSNIAFTELKIQGKVKKGETLLPNRHIVVGTGEELNNSSFVYEGVTGVAIANSVMIPVANYPLLTTAVNLTSLPASILGEVFTTVIASNGFDARWGLLSTKRSEILLGTIADPGQFEIVRLDSSVLKFYAGGKEWAVVDVDPDAVPTGLGGNAGLKLTPISLATRSALPTPAEGQFVAYSEGLTKTISYYDGTGWIDLGTGGGGGTILGSLANTPGRHVTVTALDTIDDNSEIWEAFGAVGVGFGAAPTGPAPKLHVAGSAGSTLGTISDVFCGAFIENDLPTSQCLVTIVSGDTGPSVLALGNTSDPTATTIVNVGATFSISKGGLVLSCDNVLTSAVVIGAGGGLRITDIANRTGITVPTDGQIIYESAAPSKFLFRQNGAWLELGTGDITGPLLGLTTSRHVVVNGPKSIADSSLVWEANGSMSVAFASAPAINSPRFFVSGGLTSTLPATINGGYTAAFIVNDTPSSKVNVAIVSGNTGNSTLELVTSDDAYKVSLTHSPASQFAISMLNGSTLTLPYSSLAYTEIINTGGIKLNALTVDKETLVGTDNGCFVYDTTEGLFFWYQQNDWRSAAMGTGTQNRLTAWTGTNYVGDSQVSFTSLAGEYWHQYGNPSMLALTGARHTFAHNTSATATIPDISAGTAAFINDGSTAAECSVYLIGGETGSASLRFGQKDDVARYRLTCLSDGNFIFTQGIASVAFGLPATPATSPATFAGAAGMRLAGIADHTTLTPFAGQIVYDTSDLKFYGYNGAWVDLGQAGGGVTGSGNVNYVAMWSGATSLANGPIAFTTNLNTLLYLRTADTASTTLPAHAFFATTSSAPPVDSLVASTASFISTAALGSSCTVDLIGRDTGSSILNFRNTENTRNAQLTLDSSDLFSLTNTAGTVHLATSGVGLLVPNDPATLPVEAGLAAGVKLTPITTTTRDLLSATAGQVVYNSTTASLNSYDGSVWAEYPSGAGTANFLSMWTGTGTLGNAPVARTTDNRALLFTKTTDVASTISPIHCFFYDASSTLQADPLTLTTAAFYRNSDPSDQAYVYIIGGNTGGATLRLRTTDNAASASLYLNNTGDLQLRSEIGTNRTLTLTTGKVGIVIPDDPDVNPINFQRIAGVQLTGATGAERLALTPVGGQVVYDQTDNTFYGYNGTTWRDMFGIGGSGNENYTAKFSAGGNAIENAPMYHDTALGKFTFGLTTGAASSVEHPTYCFFANGANNTGTGNQSNVSHWFGPNSSGNVVLSLRTLSAATKQILFSESGVGTAYGYLQLTGSKVFTWYNNANGTGVSITLPAFSNAPIIFSAPAGVQMASGDKDGSASPAGGRMIYDNTEGLWYYYQTGWKPGILGTLTAGRLPVATFTNVVGDSQIAQLFSATEYWHQYNAPGIIANTGARHTFAHNNATVAATENLSDVTAAFLRNENATDDCQVAILGGTTGTATLRFGQADTATRYSIRAYDDGTMSCLASGLFAALTLPAAPASTPVSVVAAAGLRLNGIADKDTLTPAAGQVVYDTGEGLYYGYNGTEWRHVTSAEIWEGNSAVSIGLGATPAASGPKLVVTPTAGSTVPGAIDSTYAAVFIGNDLATTHSRVALVSGDSATTSLTFGRTSTPVEFSFSTQSGTFYGFQGALNTWVEVPSDTLASPVIVGERAGLRLRSVTSAQKAALTGQSGQFVYQSDDSTPYWYNGSAWHPLRPEYGEGYYSAATQIVINTTGTFENLPAATAGLSDGFSAITSGFQYNGTETRRFIMSAAGTVWCATNNRNAAFRMLLNGSPYRSLEMSFNTGDTNIGVAFAGQTLVELAPGDQVTVQAANLQNTDDLFIKAFNLCIRSL